MKSVVVVVVILVASLGAVTDSEFYDLKALVEVSV